MTFQRTPAGLSNLHVFSGVDAIVFVEGGSSRSLQEVRSGQFESESSDIAFWQKCFFELGPRMTLQFRAVGSKRTLVAIAREVASGKVTHVYVAMDRDFDHLLGHMINSPKVLYTFGYSWENDVWTQTVLEEVFYTLCGVCRATIKIQRIIATSFGAFERDLHWPTYADFLCMKQGIPLLPRQSPQKVMKVSRGTAPAMNNAALRQCIREAKAKRVHAINAGMKANISPLSDCCGHVIGAFGYAVLVHLFRKFCKGTVYPRHLMDSVAIDKFFEKVRQGHSVALRAHYERQLTA
jgi:hypothetical protein